MTEDKKALAEEELEKIAGGWFDDDDDTPQWEPFDNNGPVLIRCPECGGTKLERIQLNYSKPYRCCNCSTLISESGGYHTNSGTF